MSALILNFENHVTELVEAEVARQDATRTGIWIQDVHKWRMNGSAGKALEWLREISANNPDTSPSTVTELLADRVEAEIQARPRWFSKSHLRGVVQIAREATPADKKNPA